MDAQPSKDLPHALPKPQSHPSSDVSFDGLAVATHWPCPQAPGSTDQRCDPFADPGACGLVASIRERLQAVMRIITALLALATRKREESLKPYF